MASSDAARRALLSQEGEQVTVNQRALIDKILARYAAEYSVLRELLQNADDAGATRCELRLESVRWKARQGSAAAASSSSSSSPDWRAPLQNWIFRNDGRIMTADDWNRLKRIAEGNPDPDKIGAFGVGHYSLWSVCEEPVVSSGDQLLGFYWKDGGDSLFTRRTTLPPQDVDNVWTTFFLALREHTSFPGDPIELCRFAATSLAFTTRVKSFALFLDDQPLATVTKTLGPGRALSMPSHLNQTSPKRMMKAQRLETVPMQITIDAMRLVLSFAKKPVPKPTKVSLASAFTKANTGGGIASMLQSAFGRSSSKEAEKAPAPVSPAPEATLEQKAAQAARALTTVSASVHLRVATASIGVTCDRTFERDIERSTKKPPPKVTTIQLIVQSKDEADASNPTAEADGGEAQSDREGVRQIFSGLTPRLEEQGHVFIGFKTSQTASFSGHLAARFIPTVERDALDMVDPSCATWNNELLAMGGFASRAVYEAEMAEISRQWDGTVGTARPKPEDDATVKALLDKAQHVMSYFTFRTSTPSPRLSQALEAAFFGCSRQATITLASTRGIRHSAAVRFPSAVLAAFVKDLATIPAEHVEAAPDFVAQVRARGLVKEISMEDVFTELSNRALEPDEMIACLKWWIAVSNHPSYDPSLRRRLLDSAVLSVPATPTDDKKPGSSAGTIQALGGVKFWLNASRIPTDVPLPPTCLSYEVSKALPSGDLARVFGWGELTIPDWLTFIVGLTSDASSPETNLQLSPAFSEKVFGVIARSWGALSAGRQSEVAAILSPIPCLPTRKGMQKPGDAYFSNVSLFQDDLPIVAFPSMAVKGNLEKVLENVGPVRRHVELQMIFDRLVSAGSWSHVDLLIYLSSNKTNLSSLEMDRLKKTAMLPKHGEPVPLGKNGQPKPIRYRASQLYEPTETLRRLNLPVLDWQGKPWRPSSDEAKFAFELGLRRIPPLEELLAIAASPEDADLRQRALSFLFDKFATSYAGSYELAKASTYAFVPCHVGESREVQLRSPADVFTNPQAGVLGFATPSAALSPADVQRLRLRENPPSSKLITALMSGVTKQPEAARKVFEYLGSVNELTSSDYVRLKNAPFVPVRARIDAALEGKEAEAAAAKAPYVLIAPGDAYFGAQNASGTSQPFAQVFHYIDFGAKASVFLSRCGVSAEPSPEEVATRLVRDPQRFYRLAGNTEAYTSVLRQIASSWQRMPRDLRADMRRAPFLLGSKRVAKSAPAPKKLPPAPGRSLLDDDDDDLEDEADEGGMVVHDLKRASEIVIVDDATAHMLFAASIFCAPHEDLLEGLYAELGSPRLSSLVEESYQLAGSVRQSQRSEEVKALVLERTPLFLFEKRQTAKNEIRRDAEWLKKVLDVVEVGGDGLRLTRKLRFNGREEVNMQKASAMASGKSSLSRAELTLYVAGNLEVDFFEVAMALTKHLLTRQRLQEVLLYMTLLSTSLRNLKRRGFNVDKVLAARKADREAAERAMREEQHRKELEAIRNRPTPQQLDGWTKELLAIFPDAEPNYIRSLLEEQKEHHLEMATNHMLQQPYPRNPKAERSRGELGTLQEKPQQQQQLVAPDAGGGLFSGWRNKLRGGSNGLFGGPSIPGGWNEPAAEVGAVAGRSGRGLSSTSTGDGPPVPHDAQEGIKDPSAVTPTSNIRSNVLRAVQASRGEAQSQFSSEATKAQVKEAESSYCDTSGVATDLRLAGKVDGMNVFLTPELEPGETMERNMGALQRFISLVIRPVGEVFNLDPKSLNVYCDTSGPAIAFNRGGSLFLNLRFYLAWNDAEVRRGELTNARISVYHSLSHEIAHNIERQHNSTFLFWMSSISEQYMERFARLLTTGGGGVGAPRAIEAAP